MIFFQIIWVYNKQNGAQSKMLKKYKGNTILPPYLMVHDQIRISGILHDYYMHLVPSVLKQIGHHLQSVEQDL